MFMILYCYHSNYLSSLKFSNIYIVIKYEFFHPIYWVRNLNQLKRSQSYCFYCSRNILIGNVFLINKSLYNKKMILNILSSFLEVTNISLKQIKTGKKFYFCIQTFFLKNFQQILRDYKKTT